MKPISALALVAALTLAGCGGGSGGATKRRTIVQVDAAGFNPKTVTVPAGSKVRWTNVDNTPHAITPDVATLGMSSDEMFPNGIPANASFEWEVPSGATSGARYYYHCRLHGAAGNGTDFGTGETGVVIVQ